MALQEKGALLAAPIRFNRGAIQAALCIAAPLGAGLCDIPPPGGRP